MWQKVKNLKLNNNVSWALRQNIGINNLIYLTTTMHICLTHINIKKQMCKLLANNSIYAVQKYLISFKTFLLFKACLVFTKFNNYENKITYT